MKDFERFKECCQKVTLHYFGSFRKEEKEKEQLSDRAKK